MHAGVAADDPAIPDTWSQTENIAWKLDVPGIGWSSPVVWGDHIFITSVISDGPIEKPHPDLYSDGERPTRNTLHKWMVYDVSLATGRVRWEREVHRAIPTGPKHVNNTYATETPVADGERVYATSAAPACSCSTSKANRSGRRKWRRSGCAQATAMPPRRHSSATG
jgi:outer membrane protein assembly factor BamB